MSEDSPFYDYGEFFASELPSAVDGKMLNRYVPDAPWHLVPDSETIITRVNPPTLAGLTYALTYLQMEIYSIEQKSIARGVLTSKEEKRHTALAEAFRDVKRQRIDLLKRCAQ